ncbi:MAG: T9SS type A sorting domain-containing protein [Bacteroidia bacterium]
MNKKILFVIFAFCFYKISAQVSINNYVFSTSNTASLAKSNGSLIDDIDMTTGTTVVLGGSAVTNTTSSTANLNFDFYSGGTRFTNFTVTPNGWVGLGGGVAPATLWSTAVFSGTRIAPFLGPLLNTNVPPLSSMTTSSIGRIHYKVIGTSPSRVGVIEFLRMSVNSSVVDDTTTFQVRLYENNGAIEMVYGRMKVTVGAPLDFNIGFKIAAGAHSVNASSNTSSTSSTNTNTYSSNTYIPILHNYTNGSQRAYRFTPNPPNDPTSFNISNITNNAMTLNWTDASNETGYVLYRSIDGGLTYTFVTSLAANSVLYNATGLPSGTDVYWRLFSFRESIGTQLDNVGTTLNSSIITSIADGNWNNTTTWSTGTIPTSNDSVLISASDTVLVNINTATCTHLSVDGALHFAGATANALTIMTSLLVNTTGAVRSLTSTTGTNTISVGGANTASTTNGGIINNGIIDLDNGTNGVVFNMFGNGNATITGTPSLFQLRSLQLQKNNNVNNIVEVFTPFTVFLTTNTSTLVLNSGTLKLSCAINLTPYGSTFGSTIVSSANAKLWMNHGAAIINSTTTPPGFTFTVSYSLQGELQMDSGTLNIGYGNSNLVLNNTFLRMNGGTINILGGFSHNNTGTLIMTGGNININPINGANALPATTGALVFGANANVTWTGGTINVINPQTASNNVSVNIVTGGSKLITGGLLKIGNGLQNGTGASAINTAGFGLSSTFPLYNVLIDSRFDLSSGRLTRIVGTFIVGNNLTIATGTSLLPASGVTGGNLTIRGNLINNGQVIGNFPITSAPIVGLLNFDGTSAQTISGSGIFSNLANLSINNINGVTSTSSTFGNVIRLNLLTGLLTTNGSLIIGATISKGTIQIGGIDELTTAGSLSSIPLFNPTFTTHSFIYGPSSSTLSLGAFNEMPTGSIASLSSLTISDINGLNSTKIINILDTLNLGTSYLNMNNNNLTIGSSISQVGKLIRTTGFVQMGSNCIFGRWYATGSVIDNTLTNGFPILSSSQDRSVTLNTDFNTLTTGGLFTVKHLNSQGYTNISPVVSDGFISVNRISNSNWIFNNIGITVPSIFGLQVNAQMQGVGSVASLTDLRFMKPSLGSGNTSNGTGTLNSPIISRLFSQTQVASGTLNDTFYVGVNTSSNTLTPTYIAIANGSWDNPLTWNNNSVPNSSNIVVIPSPYNVNLNTSALFNTADSIAIQLGGKLSITANTLSVNRNVLCDGVLDITGGVLNISGTDQAGLTIGANDSLNISGGKLFIGNSSVTNKTLTVNGIVNISDSGEINMNGNVIFNANSTFIQTDGKLNIDGNSGIAFTSLLAGKHMLDINTNNVYCSGGNIMFIDPPHNSLSALSTYVLRISATSNLSAFSGSHTFIFGDGSSTTPGNNSGFNVDNRKSGIVPIQNIIVNGGSTTGRWLAPSYSSGSFGLYALGNLTINSGSELRQLNASQLVIGGNIINNGTFTSPQTFTVGGLGYTVSNSQTISGSGVFRNNATSTTAEFTTLVLNNGGTTFNLGSSTLRFATALTLTSGQVNAGTNVLKIPATAAINRTNGYLTAGGLELNFALGTNISKTYFVGSSNGYSPTILTFPIVTTAGDVRLTLTNTDHPQISAGCFDNTKSINKNWNINNISVLPYSLNADLSYTSGDIDAGTTISNIIGKKYNGSAWSNISLASISATNTLINGITSNGEIQLAELVNTVASVSISASSNSICSGTNLTFTATPTNGGTSPFYQWKKNGSNVGTNSTTYSDNSLLNNDQITCTITSNIPCVIVPTVASNIITMNVITQSVGGTISGGGTICSGSVFGTLTLTGQTGAITRWESAVSPYTSWTTISNTTNTLSPGIITQNIKYRAIVQNSTCNVAISDTASIVTNTVSVGGNIAGSNTVCSGTSGGTLSLSSNIGNVLSWESSISPFTSWTSINNTTTSLATGIISQTTKFRAIVQNGICLQAISDTAQISIISVTVGGNVSGGSTICTGSTSGTLTLTGNNGTILNWESSVSPFTTWTSISNTSSTYTSSSLTQTTQFRATVQNGSCATANSVATTVTVNSNTIGGSVSGGTTICSGSTSGLLTLTGNNGTILNWESSVSPFTSWTSISNTAITYTSSSLIQTTQFRAVVQNGSCAAVNSSTTTVIVNNTTVAGTVSGGSTVCSGSTSGLLTLTGNNGTILNWESSVSPFTSWTNIANTSNTYTSSSLTQTIQFRAIVQSGSCAAANSIATTVTVNNTTIAGTVSGGTTVCSGSTSGTLTLTGNNGTILNWESSVSPFTTWTSISNTSSTYTSSSLTQTTQFRAVVQSGSCAANNSSTTTVTVNNTTVAGTVSGGSSICTGSTSGLLTLSGNTGSIVRWESAISPFTTWTTISNTTNFYTTGALTETTEFRAVVQNGSCTAVNSSSTTVSVNSSSVGGSVIGSNSICSGTSGGTLGLFGNNGTIIRWESTTSPFTSWSPIANTSNFVILGNLNDSTKYRAVVQSGTCAIAYSSVADIDVSPSVVAGTVNGPSTICSGSNPGNLVLTGNVGNVIRWESAVSPFTVFSSISNTTNTYSPGVLSQTTHFRAVVQSGACGTATTNSLVITISSSVVGGNVSAPFSAVCSGITPSQSISLTGFSGSVTTWQKATGSSPYTWTNISGSASQSSIIPSSATVNTAYRALIQSGSCGTAVSDSVVILVNVPSVGGTLSSNSPVCVNSNATLTLTGNTGNIIRWESALSPFSSYSIISSVSNPFTTPNITDSVKYRAIVKNGVCVEATSNITDVTKTDNNTWLGISSSNWNTFSNWSCGIPTITSNVNINSGTPNNAIVSTTAAANNINLGANATLVVTTGGNISIASNISIGSSAVFNPTNGIVNFIGSASQTIPSATYSQLNISGSASKVIAGPVNISNAISLDASKLLIGNSDITIASGATVNYTSGYVVTNGSGSFIKNGIGSSISNLIPIGASVNSFNGISISNSGTTDNFSFRIIDNVYPSYSGQTPSGSTITSNAVDKTWFISEGTAGGSNASLTFEWNTANELTGFTRVNSYVSHYNGTTWMASTAGSASGSNPYSKSLSGVTSFSPFGVGSGGTLPVKWIRFNGALANKITNLNWATSSEINNKGFEVERSFNGTDFKNIGFVNGNGNSNAVNNYLFNDNLSNITIESTIYYRLKQVDFDGNFEYSNTIAVKVDNANEFGDDVTISPNPFNNQIQLNFNSENNSTINLVLVDALGREVYNKSLPTVNGTNNLTIDDIADLKAGIYFAHLESNGIVTKTVKMLKN